MSEVILLSIRDVFLADMNFGEVAFPNNSHTQLYNDDVQYQCQASQRTKTQASQKTYNKINKND